jgi:hypothetical protein
MPELNFKEIRLCYMTRVVFSLFIISGKNIQNIRRLDLLPSSNGKGVGGTNSCGYIGNS